MLEFIGVLAKITLAGAAVYALYFANKQVKASNKSNRQVLEISRARFLFDLATQWSVELGETRRLVHVKREEILQEISSSNLHADDNTKLTKLNEEFSKYMLKLKAGDEDSHKEYSLLLRYCSFFEFLGYMVKSGYVDLKAACDLFYGPITLIDSCFRQYISELQKETGVPKGVFEHALYLVDSAKQSREE